MPLLKEKDFIESGTHKGGRFVGTMGKNWDKHKKKYDQARNKRQTEHERLIQKRISDAEKLAESVDFKTLEMALTIKRRG